MDLATPQIIKQGNNYTVQHGSDDGLYVQFYMESAHDKEASVTEGRPIYRDVEYIKIIPVGDKNTEICEPVTDEYRARFSRQYQAFKSQSVEVTEGTPLGEWPILTKSQVLMFKAVNVHTVEHLSQVSDTNLVNLGMGGREFRDKAISWLKAAKDGSGLSTLQKENEDLKTQIEALRNEIKAIGISVAKDKNTKNKED